MAILKTALDEEILSKSQRLVIRSIYRMSQLNEALVAFQKLEFDNVVRGPKDQSRVDQVHAMKAYLSSSISSVLLSVKIPKPRLEKESSPDQ